MPLTDLKIKNIKPKDKDQWITDEKGLRLFVKTNGAKYWRMRYRFGGKQKTLAIGVYPEISLKMARDARDEARLQIKKGIDPNQIKKEQKYKVIMNNSNTFSVLARSWWEHEKDNWVEKHAKGVWRRIADNTFKIFDSKPADQIMPRDILEVLKKIEDRGAFDVARRVLQDIKRIFSYAISRDLLKHNPASELTGVVKSYKKKHHPSMKNKELGQFMYDLDCYALNGFYVTQYALQLLVYTFTRSGEIRLATWNEFDLKKTLWRIPADRTKMGREHLVPLSKQCLATLKSVQKITGGYDYVFPLKSSWRKPMSSATMRSAMIKMGYDGKTTGKSKATPHGFRSNATSILNEQGFNPDAIERQMSHLEKNKVRAAYLYQAEFIDERTKMMQWWADFLDTEKEKYKATLS